MIPIRYAVIIELYPDGRETGSRFRIHSEIFESAEAAQNYIREARRQNLPFKSTEVVELITT